MCKSNSNFLFNRIKRKRKINALQLWGKSSKLSQSTRGPAASKVALLCCLPFTFEEYAVCEVQQCHQQSSRKSGQKTRKNWAAAKMLVGFTRQNEKLHFCREPLWQEDILSIFPFRCLSLLPVPAVWLSCHVLKRQENNVCLCAVRLAFMPHWLTWHKARMSGGETIRDRVECIRDYVNSFSSFTRKAILSVMKQCRHDFT